MIYWLYLDTTALTGFDHITAIALFCDCCHCDYSPSASQDENSKYDVIVSF